MKTFFYYFLFLILTACSSSDQVRIAKKATGPKQIYVSLQGDSFAIAVDLKEYLKKHGYDAVLSIEEGQRDVVRKKSSDVTEVIKNATTSANRYELVFQFSMIQDRFFSINSMIRDREQNELIGTYRWQWNRMFPAPTVAEGLDMLNEKLLKPTFE